MQKLERFKTWYNATIASAFGVGVSCIFNQLVTNLGKSYALIFSSGLLLVLILGAQKIMDNLLDNSGTIRRWMLGKEFIEGCWKDYAVSCVDGTVISAALLDISHDPINRSYSISGIVVFPESEIISHFELLSATMRGFCLHFRYQLRSVNPLIPTANGCEELLFAGFGRHPTTYTGFFFDSPSEQRVTLYGKKVTKSEDLKRIESDEEDGRVSFLMEYLNSVIEKKAMAKKQ